MSFKSMEYSLHDGQWGHTSLSSFGESQVQDAGDKTPVEHSLDHLEHHSDTLLHVLVHCEMGFEDVLE